MQPQQIIYLVPVVAVLALIYAFVRASWVQRQDPGNERMQLIGSWIAEGAMAFLKREYRFLSMVRDLGGDPARGLELLRLRGHLRR